MKISVIITTMLVAQVSASFMDVFQGAVLSVQNSFGKLFSDVVTDVKDTVDCTILAVEHILSLSADASARYYEKCGNAKNNTSNETQLKNNLPVLAITISNNDDYLKKELPEELDARINATLTEFLNGYNPHDKLEDVQKELAKETQRLADVSDLVRKELDKLSKEIHFDLSQVQRRGSKPSVDTVLDELKVLEAIEQNIKNTSEANEIHRLIDNVLVKLHEIESSEAMQNDKVGDILKDLEKSSNRSYKDMRHQLDDWKLQEARHLNVIKTKMDEHGKLPEHVEYAKVNSTLISIDQPNIAKDLPNYILQHPTRSGTKKEKASKEDTIYTIPIQEYYTPGDVNDNSNPIHNDIENEITPWTISSSLDKSSEYITPNGNQMQITQNKLAKPIKQFASTSYITAPTSPKLEASDVITDVPLMTNSFVNDINIDMAQTFNEKPLTDETFRNKNIDFSERILESEGIVSMSRFESSSLSDMEVTEIHPITDLETVSTPRTNQEPSTNIIKSTVTVDNLIADYVTTPELPKSLPLINHETTLTNFESNTNLQLMSSLSTINPESLTSFSIADPEFTTSPTTTKETMTSFALPGSYYPSTPLKPTTDILETDTDPTDISTPTQGSAIDLTVTTPGPTINHVTTAETVTDSESSTLNSMKTDSTTKLSVAQENTTDVTVSPDTIIYGITQESIASFSEPELTESTLISVTTQEYTTDPTVTTSEPSTSLVQTSEPTKDFVGTAPTSTTNPTIPHDVKLDFIQKYTGVFISTPKTKKTTSLVNFIKPTVDLEATTTESYTKLSDSTAEFAVTIPQSTLNLVTMSENTMDHSSVGYTNPFKTSDSTKEFAVTSPQSTSNIVTTSESTTDITSVSYTNPGNMSESTAEFGVTIPQSIKNIGSMSESFTDLMSITHTNPTKTSEYTAQYAVTIPLVTTNLVTTSESITDLTSNANPTKTSESISEFAVTIPDSTTNFVTTSEDTIDLVDPTTETTKKVITTSEPTTTLDVTAMVSATNSASTFKPPVAVIVQEPTAILSMKEELKTDIPVSTFQYIERTTINLEPVTTPFVLDPEPVTLAMSQDRIKNESVGKEAKEGEGQAQLNPVILTELTSPSLEPITSQIRSSGFATSTVAFLQPTRTAQDFDVTNAKMSIADTTESPSLTMTTPIDVLVQKSLITTAQTEEGLQVATDSVQNSNVTSASGIAKVETTVIPIATPPTTSDTTVHLIPTSKVETNPLDTQKASYQVTTAEPLTIVTASESTVGSPDTPKGSRSVFVVTTVPQPKSSEIKISDATPATTPNAVSESYTSSTEIASTSTTGSLVTTSTALHNLNNLKKVFHIATRRPNVPTPSLDAFLKFIDRKEGRIKPAIKMPFIPIPYSKTLKTDKSHISAQLNAFFSQLPSQKELLGPPKIRRDIASTVLNKNTPSVPLALSLRHLPLHESYNETTPQGTDKQNDQNPPSVQLPNMKFPMSMPQILTTVSPFFRTTTPKNNFEDADYKSFFHLPSEDTEAHKRALIEAKKLIEDSKLSHQLINSILNKKKKAISAFNLRKSINVGK